MMKANYRLKILNLLLIVTLTGCAGGESAFKSGSKAELTRDFETAMVQYKKALDQDPGNTEYRLKYEQNRFAAAFEHFKRGNAAMDMGDLDDARNEFSRAREIDPSHDFASQELDRVNNLIAGRTPGAALQPAPTFESLKQATRTPSYQSEIEPTLKGKITLKLSQNTRTAYETIAEMAGLKVIFDRDWRPTPNTVTLDFENVSIYEALDILDLQTKSFWQPVNKNTIQVIEDNSTKRRDYEEVVLKVIFLANQTNAQEVNDIMNQIRQNLNITSMTAFPAQYALIIRDSPDKVAMAEKLAYALDKAKGEVVIEATIMEVDRSLLKSLGIQPPSSVNIPFVPPSGANADLDKAAAANSSPITIRNLGLINSGSFALNIPQSVANFLATSSLTKLIERPQVRATSGQQASLLVGSNVPIQTSNTQPTLAGGSTTTQVQYTNVGVTLTLTPYVLLNREISVSVLVDVKAPAGDKQVGNTVSPVFTDRSIQHVIRLKEGETNILGGIVSSTESTSMTGLPLLKDAPILKYFFGKEQKTHDDTEVIVMLTPHIVHMPDITFEDMIAMDVGTVTTPRLPSLSVSGPNATEPPAPRPTPGAAAPGGNGPIQPGPIQPAPIQPNAGATTQAVSPTPASATVSFSAAQSAMTAQKASPLNITINGTDIAGAELTLTYDPSSISISQITDGGFLSRDGQMIAVVQSIQSDVGRARITIERPPEAAALAGSGNLVTLTITPQNKKGDSTLRISEFKLRDGRQVLHNGTAAETKITVQ